MEELVHKVDLIADAWFAREAVSVPNHSHNLETLDRRRRSFGSWSGTLIASGISFCSLASLLTCFRHQRGSARISAEVLWQFRLAAWAIQAVLSATIGLLFGWLTERDPRWSGTAVEV